MAPRDDRTIRRCIDLGHAEWLYRSATQAFYCIWLPVMDSNHNPHMVASACRGCNQVLYTKNTGCVARHHLVNVRVPIPEAHEPHPRQGHAERGDRARAP